MCCARITQLIGYLLERQFIVSEEFLHALYAVRDVVIFHRSPLMRRKQPRNMLIVHSHRCRKFFAEAFVFSSSRHLHHQHLHSLHHVVVVVAHQLKAHFSQAQAELRNGVLAKLIFGFHSAQ